MVSDVIQNPDDVNSRPTVDVVRNLRYQQGKRIEHDKGLIKPSILDFPTELNIDELKQVLSTDDFAGSMLKYLVNDELPDVAIKARNLVIQADQYYAHEGLLYQIWHTPADTCRREMSIVFIYQYNMLIQF
jgi:hypothetical protein